MAWQAYRLVFRLESPLHVGWRKIGNLMQTRYYVPGRVFLGAVTTNLARWLGETNYRQTGEWVRENLRFGYFYPAENPDKPSVSCSGPRKHRLRRGQVTRGNI